jgi:hypothetical protein
MPILALDRNVFNNLSTKDQFSTEKGGATKLSFCNTPIAININIMQYFDCGN